MVEKIEIKKIPTSSGVYIFKNKENEILYIGKAKNLKIRVSSYFKNINNDPKVDSIINESSKIDFIETKNELEALLLEAELIQSNQPKFNILLKTGQPFLYLLFTSPQKTLPSISIVRNKKKKGTYFGPFIDKTAARRVYDFLIKTFRLKLCKQKIKSGCLDYHLGICAGKCRPDFNKEEYLKRLDLAKKSLQKGHKKFLQYLKAEISKHNKKLEFEKSKELNEYLKAFTKIFESIETTKSSSYSKAITKKDIWFLNSNKKSLFVFSEKNSALKLKHTFYSYTEETEDSILEQFKSYYQTYFCPSVIIINFEIKKSEKELLEKFLETWHKTNFEVSIIKPIKGHFYNLLKLAKIHAEQEIKKHKTLSIELKNLLNLPIEPHTIDCFDISHKQGQFMVGSCIRFKDGKPDKNNFRKFKIKTVDYVDDYACLQEIVKRRYKNDDYPDLILIDGGKGQLSTILKVVPFKIEVASLAKKEETIFSAKIPHGKKLNLQNYASQILIALRDYAHHFAISYHRKIAKHSK